MISKDIKHEERKEELRERREKRGERRDERGKRGEEEERVLMGEKKKGEERGEMK